MPLQWSRRHNDRAHGRMPVRYGSKGRMRLANSASYGRICFPTTLILPSPSYQDTPPASIARQDIRPARFTGILRLLQNYMYRCRTEEHMEKEYDPFPEKEEDESALDHPDMPVVITVDDYYDLLMEQQEQM